MHLFRTKKMTHGDFFQIVLIHWLSYILRFLHFIFVAAHLEAMSRIILLILFSVTCVSGLSPIATVRRAIDRVNKENFASVTKEVEPFLLAEAGTTFYTKSMKRLGTRAKAFGIDMPETYAKHAKATEKRRSKQDAFIKSKEPELIDSE